MFKRKSVLYTWCISYGLLLLMMALMGIILGHQVRTQLTGEYKSITQTLQRQTNTSIESYFHRLERTAYEIGNDYLVMDFVATPDPSGSKYYNLNPIQQSLSVHDLQYSGTVRQYLYMNNIGRALSSGAIYRTQEFYRELALSETMTAEEFTTLLKAHHYNQLFVFEVDGQAQAMMLTSVPLVGTPRGTLVQVIPPETLNETMRAGNAVEDSTTVLLDANGTLLSWTGNESAALLLPAADLASAEDSEILLDGEPYWVECQRLTKAAWQLVTVVPMRSISEKSNWVVRQSLPIMIGMVLASGALCLLFLYIQYKPLHRLRREIAGTADALPTGNEYDQLFAAFTDARNGRDQIQALWEVQQDKLWGELLRSCVEDDSVYDEKHLREVMEHLGAEFAGDWFGIALLDAGEGTGEHAEQDEASLMERLPLAPESGAHVKLLVRGQQRLVLVNAPAEEGVAHVLGQMQNAAEECRIPGLLYACSRPWRDFQNIHLAYLEASEALHQQAGRAAEAQASAAAVTGAPFLPPEQEELLMRYILAGNGEKAQDMLKVILHNNWDEQQLPLSMCRCLAYDLLCGVLRALSTRPDVWNAQHDALRADLHQLRHGNTREEIAETLRGVAARSAAACAGAGQRAQSTREQPLDRLMQCVNEHYRDTDFNVSRAAEYLGMNVSYLSNLFKQQTGIGLLSYINGLRVRYAKQCILERHVSVAQAAHEAGFENINTFIRIFKKYEGVTPGSIQAGSDLLG